MNNLILGYGLLGKEIHRQTGWDYLRMPSFNGVYKKLTDELDGYEVVINCVGYTNGEDRAKNFESNYNLIEIVRDPHIL